IHELTHQGLLPFGAQVRVGRAPQSAANDKVPTVWSQEVAQRRCSTAACCMRARATADRWALVLISLHDRPPVVNAVACGSDVTSDLRTHQGPHRSNGDPNVSS